MVHVHLYLTVKDHKTKFFKLLTYCAVIKISLILWLKGIFGLFSNITGLHIITPYIHVAWYVLGIYYKPGRISNK